MTLLKSVFFIIDVDLYSQIFTNPRTPEKYNIECNKIGCHNFLENYFKNKLLNYFDQLLIEDTDEEKLFNNPNINLFSGVEYLTVIPVKDKSEFVVWFNSSNKKDDRRIDFSFINNGEHIGTTHFVKDRTYYYKRLIFNENDNWIITANFIDSLTNTPINQMIFNVNKDNFKDLVNNGLFTENNIN